MEACTWWPIQGMKQSTIIYNVSKDGREKGLKVIVIEISTKVLLHLRSLSFDKSVLEGRGDLGLFIIHSGRANGS